jgi:hypothetical protein
MHGPLARIGGRSTQWRRQFFLWRHAAAEATSSLPSKRYRTRKRQELNQK